MSAPLAEGVIFAGRYRIVRLVARGGMGAVYEAIHTETNRLRALKVMHPHIFESDEMRERFKFEARVAARVESEHLVDISDAGVDEVTKTPFIVMEFLRGEELGQLVKRVGPLPIDQVLTYLQQTARALDKTHAAFIVHRDLKPANLFLTQRDDGSPRIKILDFGIAKVIADASTNRNTTESLGTPTYMAPEQFHPGARITCAADIYALGLIAYTLLVGSPYWLPESKAAGGLIPFITIAVHGPIESAVERAARKGITLPAAFDTWFFRISSVKPENRFQSAGEAIEALVRVFADLSAGDRAKQSGLARIPHASKDDLSLTARTLPTAPTSVVGLGHTPGAFAFIPPPSPSSPQREPMSNPTGAHATESVATEAPAKPKQRPPALLKFASLLGVGVLLVAVLIWRLPTVSRSDSAPLPLPPQAARPPAMEPTRILPEPAREPAPNESAAPLASASASGTRPAVVNKPVAPARDQAASTKPPPASTSAAAPIPAPADTVEIDLIGRD